MPKLIRLYIVSVAIGFALATAFVGALVWLDVAGLGHLILGSDMGLVAVAMMVVFNGIVFSGAQFGFVIMQMADRDDGPRSGHRQRLIPVRVAAKAASRR
jgi:TRAP-type C4-dicarboxylate transport system permease small subunit